MAKTPAPKNKPSALDRVYGYSFDKIYALYLTKVQRKGRTQEELDTVIRWLTGYTAKGLKATLAKPVTLREFFAKAPKLNPNRKLITGTICGVRLEEIKEPLMREIRYMDKLVDELAKGREVGKVMRGYSATVFSK